MVEEKSLEGAVINFPDGKTGEIVGKGYVHCEGWKTLSRIRKTLDRKNCDFYWVIKKKSTSRPTYLEISFVYGKYTESSEHSSNE